MSTVIDTRPTPGKPRSYDFPSATSHRFPNGLGLITVDLPGRPLVSAGLVLRNGAVDEPDAVGGATILASRALSEGTERYDAIELVEADERLGAGLHADASWDAMSAGLEVPADRLGDALELLAEVVHRPTFPDSEVDRLREERLNDILQARADPRRRAEEVFTDTLYTYDSPYRRPASGLAETVERLDRAALRTAYRRGLDPSRGTFIVAGDLRGLDVPTLVGDLFGSWTAASEARPSAPIVARSAVDRRRVRVIHRPGSVQTELRIGHVGVPRRTPDFHAISVTGAILGGLFNSRLNMKLREEKGYTYGASAGWDPAPRPGSIRGAGGRQHGSHGRCAHGSAGRARSDSRQIDQRAGAARGAGLSRRRVPDPIRDSGRRARGVGRPLRERAAGRRACPLSRAHRSRDGRRRAAGRERADPHGPAGDRARGRRGCVRGRSRGGQRGTGRDRTGSGPGGRPAGGRGRGARTGRSTGRRPRCLPTTT